MIFERLRVVGIGGTPQMVTIGRTWRNITDESYGKRLDLDLGPEHRRAETVGAVL